MTTSTTGRNARRPPRRPFLGWWFGFAGLALLFGAVAVWQLSTLIFGTAGTGRVVDCSGHGDTRSCAVEWTAGDRSGTERMDTVGAPGSSVPVRVLGDDVVDASADQWIFALVTTLIFVLAAALVIGLPAALLVLGARARSRARRHLRESGEEVLHVNDAEIRTADGTPFATLHRTHPGPDFPPSSCRITVTRPTGEPYCTVDFGIPDHRRREITVHDGAARPLATVRRRLMRQSHADVFGPDGGEPPLATIAPVDRRGVERTLTGPR